jgi:peptidoglycan/LPS O-acetylase OafA/YrhL
MVTQTVQRRYDLDWLRVFAILSVFIYHSTRFFDRWFWHIKNPVPHAGVEVLQSFMTTWMMPFIFLISGASIFYAMKKGGIGTFFKDKALRLLIPLLVAVFTYSPLQVYLERITHGQFQGSFVEFLPHYFEGIYLGDGSAGNFAFVGMHMWYVFFLFIFCILMYPLFRWLKGKGQRVLEKIGSLMAHPWTTWFAMAFPLIFLHLFVSDSDWEVGSGGWPYLYYMVFLLYGFVIVSHERLQTNLKRIRWFNLALGTLFMTVFIVLMVNPALDELENAWGDLFWLLSACTLIPAFLGFGMQHLVTNNAFLKYASEAVMGFYILHQTVLLCIGYFVVRWNIPDFSKWAIIAGSSFVSIMLIYEFLIRRVNAMRFLCGMKPLKKAAVPQTVEGKIAETA